MTYPLTVWEVDGLFQTQTDRPIALFYPYVFDLSRSPSRPLAVVLADLIGRCQAKSPHDGWVWAVPTAAEWLALAGCQEGTDHPWGAEKIGPHHANLRTGGRRRLEPVGIRPAGRSVTRTWDCLGNVHELVAWNEDDYRLAGGCMRNAPSQVDARRFRPLLGEKLQRKNVGIRLIRYRVEDAERRMAVLRAYCASYPSTWM
ncbi:hypothetical protein Acor_50720 [Acrocarpospora corrugata]|uniref:Sulfatase-modifying factor enzyme domain-containing protein n=1 Tax=Acrocarpospora corrugata TaxID=35763 RepID=A0A5M3W2R0_9ACTN|nr:hypothetical protein [Acrocarpospora corrugata]GES03006.1 hypothetical protein Acor_50720 [Acrocarpospora corrugata]